MSNYRAVFESFAAGFAAAFAAGYADVAPERERFWRELRERDYESDIDGIEIGYGPGQWFEDEGEWVQVPDDPRVESAHRRGEEARKRRGYGAWVADGKARFAAARTPQSKDASEDFSLDLLSAFAAAYATGSGGWVKFFEVLSSEDLYDLAGVPPDVKAAVLAAYEVYQGPGFRHDHAEEKVDSASDFGFVGPFYPVGPLAGNLYDTGYDAGWSNAFRAALGAVKDACGDNDDIADQVLSAVSEALGSSKQAERRKGRSIRRGTSWPNAPHIS